MMTFFVLLCFGVGQVFHAITLRKHRLLLEALAVERLRQNALIASLEASKMMDGQRLRHLEGRCCDRSHGA